MIATTRFPALAIAATLLTCFFLLLQFTSLQPTNLLHATERPTRDPPGAAPPEVSPPPPPKPSNPYQYPAWATPSLYNTNIDLDTSSASITDLCKHFPRQILNTIQPVLKTGHKYVQDRLEAHLRSTSACLGSSLLIFSDKTESFGNHSIIDIIGTIPANLLAERADQLNGYNAIHNQSIQATADDGWKADKFKFVVGISEAWRLRPNMPWYVFYEDDTYVDWDGVSRYLTNFSPDHPLYFGSASPGNQIKHEDAPEEIVYFANGGPGYILSRAAMWALVKDDWSRETGHYLGSKLNERYWLSDISWNCCGDSVLGQILWNEGIKLGGVWPMMSPHSPWGVPFGERDQWCAPVLTMHKPDLDSVEPLWRWQWRERRGDRPLSYRDLALSFYNITHLPANRQRWRATGGASRDARPESPGHESSYLCAAACADEADCLQWSFETPEESEVAEGRSLGKCVLTTTVLIGKKDNARWTSGWITSRIREWVDARPCASPTWLSPTVPPDRIFMN